MKMKKCLSMILAIVMIATMITSLPITANAVDVDTAGVGEGTLKPVGSAAELKAACDEINNGAGGTYTIRLTADISDGQIDVTKSGATVTVIGNGKTISATGSAVYVSGGAKVILGDDTSALTLTSANNNDTPGIVHVLKDSSCTMNNQVTLKDHNGQNYLGGGVTVEGGTFVMDGGTITNCSIAGTKQDENGGSVCYGGGVAVFNGGHFTMNGGTIDHCYAITTYIEENSLYQNCYSGIGGGVFVTDGSEFIMNGGTISNCSASNFGGGVAMTLSDVEVKIDPNTGDEIINSNTNKPDIDSGNPRSNVTINGGLISENNAKYGAGIFTSGLIFAFADAFSKLPLDFGTPENPGLYINGGENKAVEISSNTATDMGGGVLTIGLKSPRKVQLCNAKIIDNTANTGAGIENYGYWTQMDIDGCTITNNTATGKGGGIMAVGNSDEGYTAIKNTTITDNTSGDRGAGVYYDIESEIHITGADTIQNNKFNGKDNNLNIFSLKKPVKVVGDLTGSQIGLSDPTLWDDGKEDIAEDAVSTLRLTDGYKANNESLNPADVFTSDHESWYVDYGEKYESPKTVYKYTAKKYNNTLGLPEGYDINTRDNGDLFIKVPATKFTGYTENVGYLYDELCNLYNNNNNRYTYWDSYELYGSYSNYPGTIYYDTIKKTYVAIFKMNTSNVRVLTSSDPNSFVDYYYEKMLFMASGAVQRFLDGEESTLGLKIYYYYDENDIPGLFNEYPDEEVELEYEEPLEFGQSDIKTIYKIDEFGYATTKYVIEKSSAEEVGSYDYTNEVRLVRKETVDYHINNDYIAASHDNHDGTDKDIFTDEIEAKNANIKVEVDKTIDKFYTVPEVVPTAQNTCPYIFKGWYYDKNNENDTRPVHFDSDTYTAGHDIYAHWITVDNVDKASADDYRLPNGNIYGGFDLAGVQIREGVIDTNFGEQKKPGGMRFITSLSKKVVSEINALKSGGNNIEYGYVTASATNEDWINYHDKLQNKLLYVDNGANGIDTCSEKSRDESYFGFAKNVNCTSQESNSNSKFVKEDHRSYDGYLLYTLVVTYEGATADDKAKNILARPYIHYKDANGLERVAYSEYNGVSNKLGGCYTNYKSVEKISL